MRPTDMRELLQPKPLQPRQQLIRITAYALATAILAAAAGFGFTVGVALAHLVTR